MIEQHRLLEAVAHLVDQGCSRTTLASRAVGREERSFSKDSKPPDTATHRVRVISGVRTEIVWTAK